MYIARDVTYPPIVHRCEYGHNTVTLRPSSEICVDSIYTLVKI
jgi:hypothetical protein